ncbi:SDR family oxidoreductase [Saccharopolyspora phatthalungensis]|uniref:Uncharacterized protein YbjT (DUF2867 family) n=1 Tax=Saccharopolyspora phatthalungensis TaxID=664693 RepID=A0A840Q8M1_9PSEU|nr:NAD-dependent epimerase/dehydratase family protein [Saccharopolyspora phatthalungensis]MBB5156277.1 uncharacterized protein YbjT (DUF2867 family) [Saccharopolyspora phatthalungensis]
MPKPILVTGGTGTLGQAVVRRLLDSGHDVRVLSRRPKTAKLPYEWATGDLHTGEGIGAATSGVDAIVHCATTMGRKDVTATQRRSGFDRFRTWCSTLAPAVHRRPVQAVALSATTALGPGAHLRRLASR